MVATGKLITPVSIGTSQDVNVAVQVAEEASPDSQYVFKIMLSIPLIRRTRLDGDYAAPDGSVPNYCINSLILWRGISMH